MTKKETKIYSTDFESLEVSYDRFIDSKSGGDSVTLRLNITLDYPSRSCCDKYNFEALEKISSRMESANNAKDTGFGCSREKFYINGMWQYSSDKLTVEDLYESLKEIAAIFKISEEKTSLLKALLLNEHQLVSGKHETIMKQNKSQDIQINQHHFRTFEIRNYTAKESQALSTDDFREPLYTYSPPKYKNKVHVNTIMELNDDEKTKALSDNIYRHGYVLFSFISKPEIFVDICIPVIINTLKAAGKDNKELSSIKNYLKKVHQKQTNSPRRLKAKL